MAIVATTGRMSPAELTPRASRLGEIMLEPPIQTQACSRCQEVDRCRAHNSLTGHLLCEPLTGWDLVCAARDGVLGETVWWLAVPSMTAQDVVKWLDNGHEGGNDG